MFSLYFHVLRSIQAWLPMIVIATATVSGGLSTMSPLHAQPNAELSSGGEEAPKGSAVRRLKWYVSWV